MKNRKETLLAMRIGCGLAEDTAAETIVSTFCGKLEESAISKEHKELVENAFNILDNPEVADDNLVAARELIENACQLIHDTQDADNSSNEPKMTEGLTEDSSFDDIVATLSEEDINGVISADLILENQFKIAESEAKDSHSELVASVLELKEEDLNCMSEAELTSIHGILEAEFKLTESVLIEDSLILIESVHAKLEESAKNENTGAIAGVTSSLAEKRCATNGKKTSKAGYAVGKQAVNDGKKIIAKTAKRDLELAKAGKGDSKEMDKKKELSKMKENTILDLSAITAKLLEKAKELDLMAKPITESNTELSLNSAVIEKFKASELHIEV